MLEKVEEQETEYAKRKYQARSLKSTMDMPWRNRVLEIQTDNTRFISTAR